MAVLHSHQCCVSSLLMLCFMTHITHNDVITTSSLHHSFSHYETTFLYIRASLAHVWTVNLQVIFSGFTSASVKYSQNSTSLITTSGCVTFSIYCHTSHVTFTYIIIMSLVPRVKYLLWRQTHVLRPLHTWDMPECVLCYWIRDKTQVLNNRVTVSTKI